MISLENFISNCHKYPNINPKKLHFFLQKKPDLLSSLNNILADYNDKNKDIFINLCLKNNNNKIYVYVLGLFYEKIEENYELMKKYYLLAIDLNYSRAMYSLGLYYENIENNYDLMKKYYLMAIDLNCSKAMKNLGSYYKNIEQNYELMKKYYLMAIELNNSDAMNSLALYYYSIEKNEILMHKYFLMAIDLNNSTAIYNLNSITDQNFHVHYPYSTT
jgi:TPR repeat protein